MWAIGVAALALFSATAVLLAARVGREIEHLPVPERRALYQRTFETLRTSCTQVTGPILTEYCREQAAFIERFPECDDACRALAARFTPRPSR